MTKRLLLAMMVVILPNLMGAAADDISLAHKEELFQAKVTKIEGHCLRKDELSIPLVDLQDLYLKLAGSAVVGQEPLLFRELPVGSHSVAVMGVAHRDSSAPERVLKQINSKNYGLAETHALVALLDNPILSTWNSSQRSLADGEMKLIVNLPLKMCCVTNIDPIQYVVVLDAAPGRQLYEFMENSEVINGFAQRLAELHFETKRCHRDLNFNNIFYDPETNTITLIDIAGLATEIPRDRELDYMLGKSVDGDIEGIHFVEGDVERVSSVLRGPLFEYNEFKISYAEAMARRSAQMGSLVLTTFREKWESSCGKCYKLWGREAKNPFE